MDRTNRGRLLAAGLLLALLAGCSAATPQPLMAPGAPTTVADAPGAGRASAPEPADPAATATPVPSPSPPAPPTVRKFLISTHSGSASQPVVSGQYVVWEHKALPLQPMGTYRIDLYAYDLTTGQETSIASVKSTGTYPLAAGDLAVWLEYPNFMGYRLGAPDAGKFQITGFRRLPTTLVFGDQGKLLFLRALYALSERVLVWSEAEAGDTYDIWAYDLATNERMRITDGGHDRRWPAAAGDLVVWSDERVDEGDIYAYDLDTQETFPVATAPFTQTMPSTDGRRVVWIDSRDGSDDVYAYDLETRAESLVATGPGVRILPGVWGDVVIWLEQAGEDAVVYGYDLRLGQRFPIAAEGGWPSDPRIRGSYVVWTEYRAEDEVRAIYGAALE